MNKTRKRSFTALLFVLASLFVLVLSLGIFCACDESASTPENSATESASGSTWYYGDKAPAESLGEEGDFYLNTETLASYVKEGKTWRAASEDETGVSWYYGTAAPDCGLGAEHDFYLNTTTGELYQKGADSWGTPLLTLKGTPGRDGVVWHSGKGNPNELEESLKPQDAHAGDFYLDTESFEVYQLKADGTWGEALGTLKGDPGKDAKEPIHFYDGYGDPNVTNPVENPQEGDLFLGRFSGVEEEGPTGEGSGSRLYRYHGGEWEMLMESMNSNVISIYHYDQLVTLAKNVQGGKDYAGMEVHLKTDINFNDLEPASLHRAAAALAAADWTPIGTAGHPFKGIFDGEGHVIENFKTTVSTNAAEVGFFGNVDGATIQNLHFVDVTVDATEVDSSTEDKFVGGVVVGQAQGDVTVKNVTVTNASVELAEGTAEEKAPAVGGLVGKLESTDPEKETTLKVEGSSVEGSGTTDLVADKEAVSPENVTITDSSVTDGEGNKTAWDEGGNHYAEDEDKNRTYFVGSAAEIENLLSTAEAGKSVSVTLESDLTLDGSAPFAVGADLTIDVGVNNLTVKSQGTNAGIQVEAGKNLTIKGENGKVSLDSASSKPAISVKGSGATLDMQGANVSVKNTNSGNSPAIVAEKGASVNIGGGSKITVEGQGRNSAYKEPQLATATGKDSTITVDGADTVIDLDNAIGLYASNEGTINFKNGTLNMTGGSCCVGLGLGTGAGKIVFSGGTINITGDITGKHVAGEGLENVAIAIGSTQEQCNDAEVIVSGGVINLAPTAGIAIAFGGAGADGRSEVHAGGGVKINLNAVQDGKAYAASSTQGDPGLVIYLYNDTYITGEDEVQNFKVPQLREHIAGGLWGLCGASVGFYDGTDPNVGNEKKDLSEDYPEYTKKAMGIVTE